MTTFDLAVVGAGIMGSVAALHAAAGGMRVVVVERGVAASEASGVNAGTLSVQIKRAALIPHVLHGLEWWRQAGDAMGFHATGGYTLAFSAEEQRMLIERMTPKIGLGAPIRFVDANEVRVAEPALGPRIVGASWCALDGFVDSTRTGAYLRRRLREAGVELRERTSVTAIDADDGGFALRMPPSPLRARRVLLACGAWTREVAAMLDVDLPIGTHVNTVSVTEPAPRMLTADIGHASGLLTLKQRPNGTFLIGGGWQGRVDESSARGAVDADTLTQNLALAELALPALARVRVIRAWTGVEAFVPDQLPLAGALPTVPNAYVLACVRGGYAVGPGIASAVADLMLGRMPALPLFDPRRESIVAAGMTRN
jgi:glycine/D-amino acid oxidase-like deaminating enzyme